MIRLADYERIVGKRSIDELFALGEWLSGKTVVHVNSTAVGGGVAEILNRMVPILNGLGVPTRWDVIKGGEAFYAVTKKIHNALHGVPLDLTEAEYGIYLEAQEAGLREMRLDDDIVFVHDPQPAGLVRKRKTLSNKWLWRCHIDVSSPHPSVWNFLKPLVEQYDECVFSAPAFVQKLSVPYALVCPSIDPLSEKNRDMSQEEIDGIVARLKIPLDKPLVTQVSRFDRLKDPVGVVRAFQLAQKEIDARLLLVGGTADDDPEGAQVLLEAREAAGNDPDILILLLSPTSHLEINAIQRVSTVILQKSLREGFGLTITEALWKGKPVIAGAVGGIPLQVAHERSGILTHSIEDTAFWLKRLLQDPAFARKLGENGRRHVQQNFLLTRHVRDYLRLFVSLFHPSRDTIEL